MQARSYYLIKLQYLGFRYSGWQKQPGQKTVEGMVAKTIKFVLPQRNFKILGAGRTDAKVSALDAAFELFLEGAPIADQKEFLTLLNKNLPADIRAMSLEEVSESFNIIQHCQEKEYVYLFSFGEKNHPFCAPFMASIPADLNLGIMQKAASLYEGTHCFKAYTVKSPKKTNYVRTIKHCQLAENTLLKANFFPASSYALQIRGQGFVRYQIRMIMGALISLGKGELSLTDIAASLKENNGMELNYVAPGSGLLLNQVAFFQP